MTTRLRGSDAEDWVAAGLGLSRLVPPGEEAASRCGKWILKTMAERLDLPPVGVIADLGSLLLGGTLDPLRTASALPDEDRALVSAMRRYEDAVLGRLAADSRLVTAGFAVARLPKPMHSDAVGLLVASVLHRIGYDAGFEVEPGVVRALTEKTPRETAQRGFTVLRDRNDVRARLTEGYSALVRCAQKTRDLLGDADLFALENLTILGSLTQRLAIADVLRAEEVLALAIPRRLPRKARKEGSTATHLEDESVYPVGGFSSMSTSGSIENLVTSELIYMNPPGQESEGVDLFDMRYVEGELLYYTRDEAIFVRRRRQIVFAIDPQLVRSRVKDQGLPWQRIVLVLAVLVTVTKKLVELLGTEDLDIRVVFIPEKGKIPLADEQALTDLLFGEWKDRGIASILEATWPEIATSTTEAARRALVEIVHFKLPGTAEVEEEFHPSIARVDFPVDVGTIESWSKATTDLVANLL